jgi:hypothetical protein
MGGVLPPKENGRFNHPVRRPLRHIFFATAKYPDAQCTSSSVPMIARPAIVLGERSVPWISLPSDATNRRVTPFESVRQYLGFQSPLRRQRTGHPASIRTPR